jgi:hypothetical protein
MSAILALPPVVDKYHEPQIPHSAGLRSDGSEGFPPGSLQWTVLQKIARRIVF